MELSRFIIATAVCVVTAAFGPLMFGPDDRGVSRIKIDCICIASRIDCGKARLFLPC